jgi:coenzyme F420-reducing hydrogenase alpha subunit
MIKSRILPTTAAILSLLTTVSFAEDAKAPAVPATAASAETKDAKTNAKPAGVEAEKPVKKSQSDLASQTATFGKVSKTSEAYTAALDAHDLAGGLKQADKSGAIKGTVAKVFEPRGGFVAVLNFDADYKSAMTAVVKSDNFAKFPELKNLVGKAVLVTGKVADYHGAAQIVVTGPEQIKLVE